jgi:histidyl-tRNA synthetase
MKNSKLSNTPPRGTSDWFPEDMQVRQFIFNTWRRVCKSLGYKEYLTPILENAEIYRAKSGEDVGGTELLTFKKGDEELAIRPEMTPSVTRMATRIYNGALKPLKLFSIANFYRYQKPQRGRSREFWQLNYDIFGSDSLNADVEIIQIGLKIMLSFNPPEGSFVVYINNRKLINSVLEKAVGRGDKLQKLVARVMDKWDKLSREEFINRLKEIGLTDESINIVVLFMESGTAEELKNNIPDMSDSEGLKETEEIMQKLTGLGYGDWITFQPNVIRGFDYYDGMVFEVFDNSPDNNRSLFGGGRYNGLAQVFGSEQFPAVGCAPGDVPLVLFLEAWDLLDSIKNQSRDILYYLPLLESDNYLDIQKIGQELVISGNIIETGFEVQSFKKALEYANKRNANFVVILGEEEKANGIFKVKNMLTGEENSSVLLS